MPILRFEQFMVKKTELGVAPGLSVHFMRYRNLDGAAQLVEGVRMVTHALSAEQITISVAEHGFGVAVTELLLNSSFDDVMASAARLLGRNLATYLDGVCRDVLLGAPSILYGYDKLANYRLQPGANSRSIVSPYDIGLYAESEAMLKDPTAGFYFTSALVKDAVETLSTKNVPRLGETYVAFVHPHQSRKLRDDPSWIEATKYAAPGNFMLGEIGRIDDVVFIETTQVFQGDLTPVPTTQLGTNIPLNNSQVWAGQTDPAVDPTGGPAFSGKVPVPANPNVTGKSVYRALVCGDNAAGHAISLPVELRDGGVLDFGREHALAYDDWALAA